MDIIISNASDKPIYEQITSQMKDLILNGQLAEGEQLPSIRALASDLRISVITTKRAYADLEAQGFIETVQGKGSFVRRRQHRASPRGAPAAHRGPARRARWTRPAARASAPGELHDMLDPHSI